MVGGGRRFLFIAPFSIAHLLGREGGILISFLRLSLVLSLACSLFPVFAWLVSFYPSRPCGSFDFPVSD